VRFGDDWPGTFVRGDDAAWYAACIEVVLAELSAVPTTDLSRILARRDLRNLLIDLRESNLALRGKDGGSDEPTNGV
jgi:hypothetical protein